MQSIGKDDYRQLCMQIQPIRVTDSQIYIV